MINKYLIDQNEGDSTSKLRDYQRLREMEDYCNILTCLRQYILDYFQDDGEYGCDYCSNCQTEYTLSNITIEAQKILSCVYRMNRMDKYFGMVMLIEVLQGSKTNKVKDAGLNKLKTFGIMADYPPDEIRKIAQYLTQQGYIKMIGLQYPVVGVTEKSEDVLQGKVIIEMPVPAKVEEAKDVVPNKKSKAPVTTYDFDEQLFELLKIQRMKTANQEKVPAFFIFSDATLYDMCIKLPIDDTSFLSVSGVGEVKLKKYGSAFLDVIKEFITQKAQKNPPTLQR